MSGRTLLLLKEALATAALLLLAGTVLAGSSSNHRSTGPGGSSTGSYQPPAPAPVVVLPRVRLISHAITILVRIPTQAAPATDPVVVHSGESVTIHFTRAVAQAQSGPSLVAKEKP